MRLVGWLAGSVDMMWSRLRDRAKRGGRDYRGRCKEWKAWSVFECDVRTFENSDPEDRR